MKQIRKIIKIDEELCNGCAKCIPSCMEGAIVIVNSKAKLIKDSYCDGLGACLGHCPTGALKIIEREADGFDETAAMAHVAMQKAPGSPDKNHAQDQAAAQISTSCLGAMAKSGNVADQNIANHLDTPTTTNYNWPLKLWLVSPEAPFMQGADVLLAADCAAAVSQEFHTRYAKDKVLLIACPKLDRIDDYLPRIINLFKVSKIRSCTVLRIDVPCCHSLSMAVEQGAKLANSRATIQHIVLSRNGRELTQDLRQELS